MTNFLLNSVLRRFIKMLWASMACWIALVLLPGQANAARQALLISIDTYSEGRSEGDSLFHIDSLVAPSHDVRRLVQLLPAWGFQVDNIKLLQDEKATRQGILKSLDDLFVRSNPGDDVLVYFSGHGTSWLNSSSGNEGGKHNSSALIPWDYALLRSQASTSKLALLDAHRDLRPLFQKLDDGGRNLLLVIDSCYSGALRSADSMGAVRFIPVENYVVTDEMEQAPQVEPLFPPGTYRRLTLLSAAAIGQRAEEISRPEALERWPTEDGKPHGVFTNALLHVLAGKLGADYDNDQKISPRELHEAIGDYMATQGLEQTPMLLPGPDEDVSPLSRPLFGVGRGAKPAIPAYGETRPLRIRLAQSLPKLERSLTRVSGVIVQKSDEALSAPSDVKILEMDGGLRLVHASGGVVETLSNDAEGQRVLERIYQLVASNRLHQLAMKHARGLLPFAVKPQQFGELVPAGERIGFVARPNSNATLVIITLTAQGKLSTLYPLSRSEHTTLQANRSWYLNRTNADPVMAPCDSGEQEIFAFAFDTPPDSLEQLARLQEAEISTALPIIEQMINAHSGAFVRAEKRLRTVVIGTSQKATTVGRCGKG